MKSGFQIRTTPKLTDCKQRLRVAYVPAHAQGNLSHPAVERGTVSSVNTRCAFVKFDGQLRKLGWKGTPPQACDPADLVVL
jgi:hypothetical protein